MAAAPPFDPADPRWIAHRYALIDDTVRYRFVPRADQAEFPFLTDDYIGDRAEAVLPRGEALAAAKAPAPLHFIFHSAYCASTLLCRAFDRPGVAMGLSEPVILNDIVGIRRRGEADSRAVGKLFDEALALLARPWDAGEAVIVKPSNILNAVAPGLLTLRPGARAILLYAPLATFLRSVARKGLWCRLWVRELLEGQITDGIVDLGFEAQDYFRQTDLQVAAVGWLAQHKLFHALAARFPDRVASLDSETLLEQPAETLAKAARFLALAMTGDDAAAIAAGPAFTRHSKSGEAFTATDRDRAYRAVQDAHGEEIDAVVTWAEAVAEANAIAMGPHKPL